MKFNRAYVASAVCTPSRYAWVIGRYAGTSTSKRYDDSCGGPDKQGFPNFNMALEPDRMNLGNALRDHVYVEMGHARGVATKDWKYIAMRYPQEQIAVIQRASVERLPRTMSYIGNVGIGTRGAERAGFWDGDQLYTIRSGIRNAAARRTAQKEKERRRMKHHALALPQ